VEPTAARLGPRLPRLSTLRYQPRLSVAWDGKRLQYYEHENRSYDPSLWEIIILVGEWLPFWIRTRRGISSSERSTCLGCLPKALELTYALNQPFPGATRTSLGLRVCPRIVYLDYRPTRVSFSSRADIESSRWMLCHRIVYPVTEKNFHVFNWFLRDVSIRTGEIHSRKAESMRDSDTNPL
jgi:hypothetical protein